MQFDAIFSFAKNATTIKIATIIAIQTYLKLTAVFLT